ncbi:hypothetical protein OIU84_021971 [Salix udensis]|uniref:SBP-type domain-containing protein n=1 Tax=Salix udensis TaxID=889485 RepID=A0AAD6KYF8_9ROSI|nr:hypothetical protein OIU84_021971 [Salix udensis]
METSSPSPPPPPSASQHGGDMEIHHPPINTDWDWSDLLDFSVDDQFSLSFDTTGDLTQTIDNPTPEIESQQAQLPVSDRVRKRDPRLTCSNFLAGIVPCACPEVDELLREEEAALPGKKRGCATATAVVLDGQTKRYCQQCGKFHVLSDFDEGKRSCRRKLERHNNRRRRKPADSKASAGDKEVQGDLLTEDTTATCDAEAEKGFSLIYTVYAHCPCVSLFATRLWVCAPVVRCWRKKGWLSLKVGHVSTMNSDPNSQNVTSDSGVSFTAFGDMLMDGGKDDSKFSFSPSHCDNKSDYASMCPTGRISFKLYDWNPAEFPRRLRHQIFQWLANMPVELEGYIRPGCTILTAFIAMPKYMWVKLVEDPVSYLNDLLGSGKMLSQKGRMRVYVNNMIFNVTKDGNSVMKVNVEGHAPRLHYVHPTCFEAGKPMEFVVCGRTGKKFLSLAASLPYKNDFDARFLVSFAGKYLAHDYCVALPQVHTKGGPGLHHQLYKILTHCNEPNLLGPAFIEVENESGLSNYIPILIGDTEICSEMKIIQQRFDASHSLIIGSECKSYMDYASNIRHEKLPRSEVLKPQLDFSGKEKNCISGSCCGSNKESVALSTENLEQRANGVLGAMANSNSNVGSDEFPLLTKDVVMRMDLVDERPKKSCGLVFVNRVLKYRPSFYVIAVIAVCFGVCAIVLHPHKIIPNPPEALGRGLIPDFGVSKLQFLHAALILVLRWDGRPFMSIETELRGIPRSWRYLLLLFFSSVG